MTNITMPREVGVKVLEALNSKRPPSDHPKNWDTKLWEAIADLEKALAQPEQEPVVGTKTWFEDGKVVTQYLTASDIYKEPEQEPTDTLLNALDYAIVHGWPAESLMRLTAIRGADKLRHSQSLAQPEQEPVAVWELQEDGWDTICDGDWLETLPVGTKLYTTPPQREWIGLTHADWNSTFLILFDMKFRAGAEWAEAKLKEKNN